LLRQVAWASIPIWSIGFLSFVPFLGFAVINRRRRDWVVFGVYLAATIAMIVSLGAVNSSSGAGAAVGGFIVALAGCAAVHTAVLFRPGREQAAVPAGAPTGAAAGALAEPASLEQANREAVARAKSRLERWKEARRMVAAQPDLARDLKIGRPDLPRDYDDGGLVDVNHVPGAVLSAQLGLAPAEVTDVLTARERLGRFTSADELCAYTQLSPDRVDELRELMIFT
jgi:DNA uptake protein ComE-like DNA-binding protein